MGSGKLSTNEDILLKLKFSNTTLNRESHQMQSNNL